MPPPQHVAPHAFAPAQGTANCAVCRMTQHSSVHREAPPPPPTAQEGTWYIDHTTLLYDAHSRNGLGRGLLPGAPVGVGLDGSLHHTDVSSPTFVGYIEQIQPDGVAVVMLAPRAAAGIPASLAELANRLADALAKGQHSVEIEDMAASLEKGRPKKTIKAYSRDSVHQAGLDAEAEYARLHGMVLVPADEYDELRRQAQAYRHMQQGGDGPMVA